MLFEVKDVIPRLQEKLRNMDVNTNVSEVWNMDAGRLNGFLSSRSLCVV